MLHTKKLFPAIALVGLLLLSGCGTQNTSPVNTDTKKNSETQEDRKSENTDGMTADSAAAFANKFYEEVLANDRDQFESENKKIIEEMKAAGIDTEASEPPTDKEQLATAEKIIRKYTPFAKDYYISEDVDDLKKIEIYNKLTTDVYATKDLGAPTKIVLSPDDITLDEANQSASFKLGSLDVTFGDTEFEEKYAEAMTQRATVIVMVWVDGGWLFDSESLLEAYEVEPGTDDANNGSVKNSDNTSSIESNSETE